MRNTPGAKRKEYRLIVRSPKYCIRQDHAIHLNVILYVGIYSIGVIHRTMNFGENWVFSL